MDATAMEEQVEPHVFPENPKADLKDPRRCTCGRVLFWLLWLLLFLVLATGATALILYFVYQPQAPSFDIVHFQVQNVTVSTASILSAAFYLDAVAIYALAGYNPNKGTIYYNYMNITVNFNDVPFGNSTIPAFSQGPESSTVLNGTLLVDKFPLTLSIGPAFLSVFNTGVVPFQVVTVVGAHLNILGITSPTVTVELRCNVTINLSTSLPTQKDCSTTQLTNVQPPS